MTKINNPIAFSEAAEKIISEKLADPNFTHQNWSDEDLLEVRQEIRQHYRGEQRLTCSYCRNPISSRSASGASIEHIIPKSQYPQFIFEPKNLCLICPDCNEIKRKKDSLNFLERNNVKRYPRVSRSFKIVHPHYDVYSDHIIKANRAYIDLTPKGALDYWCV
ncbi:HNH endonuclease [Stutzerimonas kunmingensis]|uniref:HNH endonuclease n=1 Tax=Stutzerimonas kunmingensis TaxID=1211807 RepID=UPI0028A5EF1C|nr:HNH endonuclease [Stutzerimonas kunmingensis]